MSKQQLLIHILIACSFLVFNAMLYVFFPNLFFFNLIPLTVIVACLNVLGMFLLSRMARKKTTEKEKMFVSIISNGTKFLIFLVVSLVFVKITPSQNHKFLALYLLLLFTVYSILEIRIASKKG